MSLQLHTSSHSHIHLIKPSLSSSVHTSSSCYLATSLPSLKIQAFSNVVNEGLIKRKRGSLLIVSSSRNAAAAPSLSWGEWVPEKGSKAPLISDVVWPAAGAFLAMALMGKIDQMLLPKGASMTIAPFGAVCAVLFTAPSSPSARKYNMFMAQIGCATLGVLSLAVFGPGWLARSAGLAAAVAFMIYTRAIHPPAASLPILFIDGVKLHHLNYWYAFFPGAAGCVLLCLIQEVVSYLKENFKF